MNISSAVSYSSEIQCKKEDIFAYIEIDDRRASKACHFFVCDPDVKKQV